MEEFDIYVQEVSDAYKDATGKRLGSEQFDNKLIEQNHKDKKTPRQCVSAIVHAINQGKV